MQTAVTIPGSLQRMVSRRINDIKNMNLKCEQCGCGEDATGLGWPSPRCCPECATIVPRDSRIDWHLKYSGVKSELAVMLAISTSERGNRATHEWQADLSRCFENIINTYRVAEPANDPS